MQADMTLPSELTIYTAAQVRPQWLSWLNEPLPADAAGSAHRPTCRIDAAGVDEVDAAGVQLLLSLSNELALRNAQMTLVNPSQPLSAACTALGLAALLNPADVRGGAR